MEVHSHTHSARKKWYHYFWEFIMLFLAVFCGFLAENQREHIAEHHREKDFMESLLNDIASDNAKLRDMDETFTEITQHIDSLTPLLQDNELMDSHANAIYFHQIYLNIFDRWIYSDRTIDQLKNSGSFRLIRKSAVSNSIIDYDGYVRNYIDQMQAEYLLPQFTRVMEAGVNIFRSGIFRTYYETGGWNIHPLKLPTPPYFISTEKILVEKFINLLNQYAVGIEWFQSNSRVALKKAIALDSLIRKEYHLDH